MIGIRAISALILLAVLPRCGDETLAGYGAAGKEWQLTELDGKPFAATATLAFRQEGKLEGDAPCNRYFGEQTAPYPWFSAERIGATRRACPELEREAAYLAALQDMTLAEVAGDTMILSNDAGREMVFTAGSR